jgi:nickel transport protein
MKKIAFLVFVSLLLWAVSAAAHRVVIFGWIEGDTVFTESQYPDGKRVKNGKILVYTGGGKELLTGTTSDNGQFSFKIPNASALRVVIQAGMGHQGEWMFSEQEIQAAFGGTANAGTPEPIATETPAQPTVAPTIVTSIAPAVPEPQTPAPDLGQLEQMVERVVDKKLQPITRMLAQMEQKGPTAIDIFGGIGYILGLAGVAAYFLSRKNQTKK